MRKYFFIVFIILPLITPAQKRINTDPDRPQIRRAFITHWEIRDPSEELADENLKSIGFTMDYEYNEDGRTLSEKRYLQGIMIRNTTYIRDNEGRLCAIIVYGRDEEFMDSTHISYISKKKSLEKTYDSSNKLKAVNTLKESARRQKEKSVTYNTDEPHYRKEVLEKQTIITKSNGKGMTTTMKIRTNPTDDFYGKRSKVRYEYLEYDQYGYWTKRVSRINGEMLVARRVLYYYK